MQTTATGIGIREAIDSYTRHLRARNLAPITVRGHSRTLGAFADYLEQKGMPTHVGGLSREHIETWQTELLGHLKASTVSLRHTTVGGFLRWLVEEGEIRDNPMARVRPPAVPESLVPVLQEDDLRRLLSTCRGNTFQQRRDLAVLAVLIDTGCRVGELAGLRCDDVDLTEQRLTVMGKGRRPRVIWVEAQATRILDRYVRVRAGHPAARSEWFWVGHKGRLADNGIRQIVERRAEEAGLGHVFPHMFRHTFNHRMQASGAPESAIMALAGWKTRTMLSRYGASAAAERAREVHRRLSPLDQL